MTSKLEKKMEEWVYNDFGNPKFKETYKKAIEDTKYDLCFNGKVQSGKTKIILHTALLEKLHDRRVVIIAWDKRDILDQTMVRLEIYNEKIKKELKISDDALTATEISTKIQQVNINDILVLILTKERLSKLFDIITQDTGSVWTIIIDEADMSIRNERSPSEFLLRQLLKESRIRFVYVGATNFSLFQSEERMKRSNLQIQMPLDIYTGCEYRDYFHHKTMKIETDLMLPLQSNTYDGEDLSRFSRYVRKEIQNKVSVIQPNIALINIFRKNNPKYELAEVLSKKITDSLVMAYTGEGYMLYEKGFCAETGENQCIGKVLSKLKDNGFDKNIIIIATGLAGRAQTIKSLDNEWILTHFFIELSMKSSIETIVQSMRGNGQYGVDQVGLRIYSSNMCHKLIAIANKNNNRLMDKISKNVPMREISFLTYGGKPIKFTNRRVGNEKWRKNNKDHGCFSTLEKAIYHAKILSQNNDCSGYIHITKKYEIMMDEYMEFLEKHGFDDDLEKLKTENIYDKMSRSCQYQLKKWIQEKVEEKSKVSLCYRKKMCESENQLYILKPPRRQYRIVALDPENKKVLPVVVYNRDFIDPAYAEVYANKVLIWDGTDGKCRIYINKPGIAVDGYNNLS